MKKEIYLVINSGCYDYSPYYKIEIITHDKQKAQEIFKESVRNAKIECNFDEINKSFIKEDLETDYIIEKDNNECFMIYKNGYAIEETWNVELLKKEVV